jgi:hypothetical protein
MRDALYRFFHGRFEETLGLGADAADEPYSKSGKTRCSIFLCSKKKALELFQGLRIFLFNQVHY